MGEDELHDGAVEQCKGAPTMQNFGHICRIDKEKEESAEVAHPLVVVAISHSLEGRDHLLAEALVLERALRIPPDDALGRSRALKGHDGRHLRPRRLE